MRPTCVVHMTPVEGSMQASARVARFLAKELGLPLVDSLGMLQMFCQANKARGTHASYDVIMLNGPIAFCGFRDELGDLLLRHTARLVWVQQDYTIALPPHHSYSRPTKAETPFRVWFHSIPEVRTWTTCKDTTAKRYETLRELSIGDAYMNWNALTYAPYKGGDEPCYDKLCYYGALRQGRVESLKRLLAGVPVHISVSRPTEALVVQWKAIAPQGEVYGVQKNTLEWTERKVANGNQYGDQPLLPFIGNYWHSLYVADDESNRAFHSLANRFYEVLSTPHTVLWLDAAGERTYQEAGLDGWEQYAVETGTDLQRKMKLTKTKLCDMAAWQRAAWLAKDPYKDLRQRVKQVYKTWSQS